MSAADTGQRIKKIREYRSYTQSYMATKLKIGQNTYSKIENGIIEIKSQRLEKIANILNVSVESILNNDLQLLNVYINKDKKNKKLFVLIENLINEVQQIKEQNNAIIQALKVNQNSKVPSPGRNIKSKK